MSEKRPWLAALLAFVHPGLGHAYLREWTRALLWFALVLLSASLLIPETATPQAFSLESLRTMSETMPTETVVAIVGITLFSMVDAYWIATRHNRSRQLDEDGASCPNCGKEVDSDIDFCHWCTTELNAPAEESEEPSRA